MSKSLRGPIRNALSRSGEITTLRSDECSGVGQSILFTWIPYKSALLSYHFEFEYTGFSCLILTELVDQGSPGSGKNNTKILNLTRLDHPTKLENAEYTWGNGRVAQCVRKRNVVTGSLNMDIHKIPLLDGSYFVSTSIILTDEEVKKYRESGCLIGGNTFHSISGSFPN